MNEDEEEGTPECLPTCCQPDGKCSSSRLALINSEDAVLGTWTKNSTLNLLCKNANGCIADYITELSTSSIVLFSKITDEFVILVIYNESSSLLSKVLVEKDGSRTTVAKIEISPESENLFLEQEEQWKYERGILSKEESKFELSKCSTAGSDCSLCQKQADPECRFVSNACVPVDLSRATRAWGCSLEPLIPQKFYLLKVQIPNSTISETSWLHENGEKIESSFGNSKQETFGVFIEEEELAQIDKLLVKAGEMNYEVKVTENMLFTQSPMQQMFNSKDKNMGCEERLKSAFIEKTKVEMALHRNLKSQKETEISLNEKIAESQNLFDENSQLKIAIENNKREFGAEKENLKGEIEKIEKKLEELKKELKIRNEKMELKTAEFAHYETEQNALYCGNALEFFSGFIALTLAVFLFTLWKFISFRKKGQKEEKLDNGHIIVSGNSTNSKKTKNNSNSNMEKIEIKADEDPIIPRSMSPYTPTGFTAGYASLSPIPSKIASARSLARSKTATPTAFEPAVRITSLSQPSMSRISSSGVPASPDEETALLTNSMRRKVLL